MEPQAALRPGLLAPASLHRDHALPSRAQRDLMLAALAVYLVALYLTHDLGNAGLWSSFLVLLAARGVGQVLLYEKLTRRSFSTEAVS